MAVAVVTRERYEALAGRAKLLSGCSSPRSRSRRVARHGAARGPASARRSTARVLRRRVSRRLLRALNDPRKPEVAASDHSSTSTMDAIRDMYDLLPPDRAAELRRRNKERLAELEALGDERRRRLAQVLGEAPLSPASE